MKTTLNHITTTPEIPKSPQSLVVQSRHLVDRIKDESIWL